VINEPFSVENDLLTPKLSVKRPAVTKRFQKVLDGLYAA
jgi:long-subunit acyl-CoA synthetase (AMP-forming)